INGAKDHLIGLKENVIIGKLIPAGSGAPQNIAALKERQRRGAPRARAHAARSRSAGGGPPSRRSPARPSRASARPSTTRSSRTGLAAPTTRRRASRSPRRSPAATRTRRTPRPTRSWATRRSPRKTASPTSTPSSRRPRTRSPRRPEPGLRPTRSQCGDADQTLRFFRPRRSAGPGVVGGPVTFDTDRTRLLHSALVASRGPARHGRRGQTPPDRHRGHQPDLPANGTLTAGQPTTRRHFRKDRVSVPTI